MEGLNAGFAAPGPLRRFLDLGHDAVHVVAAVAVIAEQQLEHKGINKHGVFFIRGLYGHQWTGTKTHFH